MAQGKNKRCERVKKKRVLILSLLFLFLLFSMQNRDKCASRDHLHLTVEELRIFNARRKLKNLIVATSNSVKWDHPSFDTNCDAFSDIDDDESISSREYPYIFSLPLLWQRSVLATVQAPCIIFPDPHCKNGTRWAMRKARLHRKRRKKRKHS